MSLPSFLLFLLCRRNMTLSVQQTSSIAPPPPPANPLTPLLHEQVHRISVNPLGVEYKMLGEKDGFVDGMETTILLTTITKIGSLMRVGFGEAGASVIAKNLADSTGGRLNLMGGGTMIHSIFGFCDVRQFTDTTECLQEEVRRLSSLL